jgi:RHH-type proline utilization regulon transcriptional repressor/proline dehydrogenase/delta 1-pyrroline-5-carboxylate dehydrogenase
MLLSATPHSAPQAEQGGIKLALGSHNMRSIAHAIAVTESLGLPRSALELQMLHGMADQIKAGVDALGMRVREYFPVGEMIPGMAYFVRRLLENTSNESWLRAGFPDNVSVETLFANPARSAAEVTKDPGIELIEGGPERHALSPAAEGVGDGRPFFSAPHRSFGSRQTRDAFADAIRQVSLPDDDAPAGADDADRALDAAAEAFADWRDAEPSHRARILVEAGRLIRDRRDQLCGIMIKETGHTWREADNEICEAIDFCEYYARHAVHLFRPKRLGRFIGELNEVVHEPRGVAVIVSPWSHPLSIGCGMAVAALVTGNPIILCPANQATAMGRALRDVFVEAGVPAAAVHVLARADQSIRDRLVADPRTATIAYAGPAQPSFKVRDEAARDLDEQMQVKEVICDLAGKNAVIVDTSADLDDAVRAIRDAAFSYQGQKHSTCSRAIIVASRYDQFIERLVGYTRELTIGDPLLATTDIGPLVDVEHADAVRAAIEEGKTTARLALALDLPDDLPNPERYVAPHIFADVRPDQRLAREIIFGPVLSVMKADSFDDALAMANDSPYRLTGGVYSRKPSHIEHARRAFRVGNLYINRSIVGSAVGRQPFGGLGLSGVGAMSGGDTYLLQFVSPRTVTENTMRRGFAPEL